MAEERLIDEDKDKNLRIKLDTDEETSEEGGAEFVVPDDYGDERDMTEEELAAKRERQAKEREEREKQVKALLKNAADDCNGMKFATALEFLESAEELDPENGEIHVLRMRAYTRNFTDYMQITDAAESAEKVTKFTSAERKADMLKMAGNSLDENIAALRKKVTSLHRENEAKKAERAVLFVKDRNMALIFCGVVLALLATFIGLAVFCYLNMYRDGYGVYVALTWVFGGLAAAMLVTLAFAARKLSTAMQRIKMNNRNTSTQLGRDLLTEQAKLKAFIDVNNALKS